MSIFNYISFDTEHFLQSCFCLKPGVPESYCYCWIFRNPIHSGIKVFFDGSCEPNPSYQISYGAIIIGEYGQVLREISQKITSKKLLTNNAAEYAGLISSFRYLLSENYQAKSISFFGDSRLVIKQMNGEWSVDSEKPYGSFAVRSLELKKQFSNAQFIWIPREQNQIADALSRKAMFS